MSVHVLAAQTAVLVVVSLAILYPVVAYARTLLYTDAVSLLAASVLVFTAGSVLEEGLGMTTASEGTYLFSCLCFAASVWLFAREFVRVGGSSFDADDAPASSGFGGETGDAPSPSEQGFAGATEGDDGE
ncbi:MULTISPECIES: hypothetical protein [Halolamina]|uniref:Uncharacterized protein n=1 Tax=Halolamina pelagica TaxID=699431 RepID=A0A1I5Q284_9EURY|nr:MULTISPECIES: hypothetical protein [Halolamina]NHX35068.1 hypothetical protein [Halolamina sp. R1-12]SFP40458.1 hypothetical protein SAMN05216277_103226 [Halolamina pelagica]